MHQLLRGGPLPVTSKVITPVIGVITPVVHVQGHLGVSLNGGTPKTPQNDHFSRKSHGCWVPPF